MIKGSGSILESLRLHKPLIVVVNENLMDNHQVELAIELQNKGFLVCSLIRYLVIIFFYYSEFKKWFWFYFVCNVQSNFLEALKSRAYENLNPFPEPDESLFANILNEEMSINL